MIPIISNISESSQIFIISDLILFRSPRLSKFWGRDIYLGAVVLLPFGFNDPEHANAKYPLMIYHGHFTPDFETPVGFRPTPPDPDAKDYDYVVQEYSYYFYRNWTGDGFRGMRMIIVVIQHANPYYDDSYAVNSANLGPYVRILHSYPYFLNREMPSHMNSFHISNPTFEGWESPGPEFYMEDQLVAGKVLQLKYFIQISIMVHGVSVLIP
jgi:hypothetical protein